MGHKLLTFARLLGGWPNYADSTENGATSQSRLAPLAGVRRILRATPCAAGSFQFLAIAKSYDLGGLVSRFWHLGGHIGTLRGKVSVFMIPRPSGNVKDLLKLLFLTLAPPNYSN